MSDNLLKLAEGMSDLIAHDKILYLKTEPEIADFTRPFSGKIIVFGGKRSLTIPCFNKDEITNVFNQLRESIFSEGFTVIFWNLKNIATFFKFHLPKQTVSLNCKFIDLKLVESFLDIRLPPPVSLEEALRRLNVYVTNEDLKKIHNKIHKPLALQVVPAMETFRGVINTEINKYVYPSYEIEEQAFGRLNCHKAFDNCVTPLNMGPDKKKPLKLQGERDFFVSFDFKHEQVSVLQWVTQDENLKKAMESNEDAYKGIYQSIFKEPCDSDEKREVIKGLFLPIMFGLYPENGSQLANVRLAIKNSFKTAWDFMESHQEQVKSTPIIKDYFGRPRSFSDKPLRVRGFLVQSPSAIFCQEKLIELYNSLDNYGKLIYSIHDGYILFANQENLNRVVVNGLKVLQSESKMCKGLNLKVSCSIGVHLNHMRQIQTNKGKNVNS